MIFLLSCLTASFLSLCLLPPFPPGGMYTPVMKQFEKPLGFLLGFTATVIDSSSWFSVWISVVSTFLDVA